MAPAATIAAAQIRQSFHRRRPAVRSSDTVPSTGPVGSASGAGCAVTLARTRSRQPCPAVTSSLRARSAISRPILGSCWAFSGAFSFSARAMAAQSSSLGSRLRLLPGSNWPRPFSQYDSRASSILLRDCPASASCSRSLSRAATRALRVGFPIVVGSPTHVAHASSACTRPYAKSVN
ncbi:hypothetical protein DIZ27_19270 [Streptomyces sp. NWU339]|nr:hypothetical protein DIZ27_19270 [Streptomyces sp. NWU339]